MPKAKSRRTILQQMVDRPGGPSESSIFDAPLRFGRRVRNLPAQESRGTGPPFKGASNELLTGAEGIGVGLKGFLRGQAPGIRRVTGSALVKDVLNSRDIAKLSAVVGIDPKVLGNKPVTFLQRNTGAVEKALGPARAVTLSLTMGLVGAVSPVGRSGKALRAAQKLAKAARAPGAGGKLGSRMAAAGARTRAAKAAPLIGGKLGTLPASAAKNVAQAAQAAAPVAAGKGLGRPGFTRRALTALKNKKGKFGTAVMATWLADMIVEGVRGPKKGGLFSAIGSLFDTETTRGTPKTPEQVEAEAALLKGAVESPAAQSRFKQLLRTRRFKHGLARATEEETVRGFDAVLLRERTRAIERLEKRMTKFKQANPDVPPAVAIRILNKRPPSISEIINPPDADTEAELTLYDTIADFLQAGSPLDRRENTDLLNRANAAAPVIGETGAIE